MTLLKCGHAAQATDQLGRAVCIICWPSPDAIEEADLPNLATRIAHCSYYQQCGSEKPSDTTLPFFEYRGPGSPWTNRCRWDMYVLPHTENGCYIGTERKIPDLCSNRGLVPEVRGPSPTDEYYCGCKGWD